MLKLAWRLFRRDWRGGELGIPSVALVLAVAIVTTLGLFVDRLQRAVEQRGATFMAGDLVLRGPRAADPRWLGEADAAGLRNATVLGFATMVMRGEAMQLATVKAVDAAYPLLGRITIADAIGGVPREVAHGPARGEVWLDERLLPALAVAPGECVVVGEIELRVAAVLLREPDAAASFVALGPRLMMPLGDVAAAGVVQPGSRVQYAYLLAGERQELAAWRARVEPQLAPGQRFVSVADGPPRVARALARAESFLLLGGSLGVVLAGVALAMAVRRYAARHGAHVAVLKTLGLTVGAIRAIYALNMLWLLLPGTLLGWLLAWLLQAAAFSVLGGVLAGEVPPPGSGALWLGAGTGALGLLGLATPPLLALSATSPAGVLRRELAPRAAPGLLYACASITLVALLRWYSGDWLLTFAVLVALLGVAVVVGGASYLLLRRAQLPGVGVRGAAGLAFAGLRRHAALNALQALVFGFALMLALLLLVLRTALVDDWQRGLDPRAPNHFLLNIAPHQVAPVEEFLAGHGIRTAGLYPMVPGRIVAVDGRPPVPGDGETLDVDRELNLTWSDTLPPDNELVAGAWWGGAARDEVSVESGIAQTLGLGIGSVLTLQVGPSRFDAEVSSIRKLDWDSMRPNFFLMFPRHLLEREAAMWLTSFHADRAQREVPAALLRTYPTLTLLEVDALLAQVRDITAQLAQAISLVLALLALAALLVMVTSVRAGLDARLHEGAMLRVLGAPRRLVLGSLVIEFALLGAFAGTLAAAGAEGAAWIVQTRLMEMEFRAHAVAWLAGPLLGALLSALLGLINCRTVVSTPPLGVLRAVD